MEKTKIDLDVLLPEIPNERDACVQRMITLMEGKEGIERVHVVDENQQGSEPWSQHGNLRGNLTRIIRQSEVAVCITKAIAFGEALAPGSAEPLPNPDACYTSRVDSPISTGGAMPRASRAGQD